MSRHQNYHPRLNVKKVMTSFIKWQPSWMPSWISQKSTWRILKLTTWATQNHQEELNKTFPGSTSLLPDYVGSEDMYMLVWQHQPVRGQLATCYKTQRVLDIACSVCSQPLWSDDGMAWRDMTPAGHFIVCSQTVTHSKTALVYTKQKWRMFYRNPWKSSSQTNWSCKRFGVIDLKVHQITNLYITTSPTRGYAAVFQQALQTVTEVLFTTLQSCRHHCRDMSGVPFGAVGVPKHYSSLW